MATKTTICPTCQLPWPKFCPRDGTPLAGAWTCPNAMSREQAAAEEAAKGAVGQTTLESAVESPLAALAKASAPEPKAPHGGGMSDKKTEDTEKTVLLSPAVPASAALDFLDKKKKGGGDDAQEAKTELLSAVSPEKKKGLLGGAALDQIADQVKADAGAAKKKKKKKKKPAVQDFSETQWFMKGVEVDADLLEIVDEEDYVRDENISEEERKDFTLRKDGE